MNNPFENITVDSYKVNKIFNMYDNTNLLLNERLDLAITSAGKFIFEMLYKTLSEYIRRTVDNDDYDEFLSIAHIDGIETYNKILNEEKFSNSESYFAIKDTIITIIDKGEYKHIFVCNTAYTEPGIRLKVYGCNISLISRLKRYIYNTLKL